MAKDKDVAGGGDPKLKALTETIAAIAPLEKRTDQLDVLRAAAQFFGLVILMELQR